MRELLIVLILSFLVFLNVRLWGKHEFSFQDGHHSRRITCDMPTEGMDLQDDDVGDQFCDEKVCDVSSVYTSPGMDINAIFSAHLSHSQLSELVIHQLIQLVVLEMHLIERMIYPIVGNVHTVIRDRKKMVSNALPTSKMIFDMLLSAATQSSVVDRHILNRENGSRNLYTLLNREDKKLFLHMTYQRLADAKKRLHAIQYHIALRNFGTSP